VIEGPKQPSNDIDVYLASLIDDLKILWDKGVDVYDAYKKENFTIRSMIFYTISDFPAYGSLSGYSTKGHRRSLARNHPYRKKKREFDGKTEYGRVGTRFTLLGGFRSLKFPRGYVRNQARPKGSIVTGYLTEELVEFGNYIMKGVENIGIVYSCHKGRLSDVGTIGLRLINQERDALNIAHSLVL
nr:hypothetical protein [Tanacetum cinerariifolium]